MITLAYSGVRYMDKTLNQAYFSTEYERTARNERAVFQNPSARPVVAWINPYLTHISARRIQLH